MNSGISGSYSGYGNSGIAGNGNGNVPGNMNTFY